MEFLSLLSKWNVICSAIVAGEILLKFIRSWERKREGVWGKSEPVEVVLLLNHPWCSVFVRTEPLSSAGSRCVCVWSRMIPPLAACSLHSSALTDCGQSPTTSGDTSRLSRSLPVPIRTDFPFKLMCITHRCAQIWLSLPPRSRVSPIFPRIFVSGRQAAAA